MAVIQQTKKLNFRNQSNCRKVCRNLE